MAAIELNLSCPNVQAPDGGVSELVAGARSATAKPLYAKLSPALPDVAAVAVAAERAGADGFTLVNTIRGLSLDEKTLVPTLATSTGGLSGPALRPIALAAVHACYTVTELPIVGVGGVESGRHALELIAVGASAVGLGTILFREPGAPARVRAELASELAAIGLSEVAEARGIAHAQRRRPVACIDKKTCKTSKMVRLEPGRGSARMPRHAGFQDAGAGSSQIARPAHGGTAPGK